VETFIYYNFSNIITVIEIIAAVTGLLLLKKYKHTVAIFFIYFLCYAVFVDNFGSYVRYVENYDSLHWVSKILKNTVFEKNYWWYQIFWTIGSPLFFSFYFFKISVNKKIKITIKTLAIAFASISLLLVFIYWELLFKGDIKVINILSLLLILYLVASYCFELLKSDKILNFYKSISFYISVGILVFWITITPVTFYEVYFSENDWEFVFLKWQIFIFAILFMYITFTIGLIVSKPEIDK